MDLRIEGATLGARVVDIDVDGGRIVAVAGREEGATGLPDGAGGEPARRVIDATGLHAFPSLANGHTHVAMTLFRGYGDDLPLMEWLRTRIWPAEALLTEDDVYHGARLALLEMVRSGTTYFNDMYWHSRGVRRAAEEMGVRAHIGSAFIDRGDEADRRRQREVTLREVEERDGLGPLLRRSLSPHAIYTVEPDSIAWLADLAREHDLLLHIHLSETEQEVRDCVATHGVRPTELLDRLGALGPNLVAAHGVYLDRDEMALLAERGATVVHNPVSNLKLATGGILDYATARAVGLRVTLGTDGAASNNNLDLFEETKIAALLQKHRAVDPTVMPAHEALAMTTTSAAEAFRLPVGRIEPGAAADLILVDLSDPSTQPLHDPVSTMVYAATGRCVHTTICDGRVLMHDRTLEQVDADEVVREAGRSTRSLMARIGS